ncbi:hypothetical protein Droror1_Dr00002444, partial [Drosera rotundifolia]
MAITSQGAVHKYAGRGWGRGKGNNNIQRSQCSGFSSYQGHDEKGELLEFKTDEEKIIDGLDKVVLTMKKGELALLIIAPEYAFGSSESKQELAIVPPNSAVYYEVELVSFEKEKESWDMNTQEKIKAAETKKEEGNALFKASKYARASKRYEKGAKYIEYDTYFSDEEKKQSQALKITCNLNNAACKLKLKDYKQAEKLYTKVLELDSRNVKALDETVKFGDTFGHTGDIEATFVTCKDVDEAFKIMIDVIEQVGGIYVITANHGNAEDMVKREQELKGKFEQSMKEALDKYQGANLYINNLDDSIDDEKLKDLFSEYVLFLEADGEGEEEEEARCCRDGDGGGDFVVAYW